MSTLTSCLRKAGKNISREDREAILMAAQKYRKTMDTQAAAERAVDEQIERVKALLDVARTAANEPQAPTPAPSAAPAAAPTEAAAPAPQPLSKAQQREQQREVERELYRELSASPDLDGKGVSEIANTLEERLAKQDVVLPPERLQLLAKTVHKQLLRNAAERQKAEHRNPAVLAAAIGGAVTAAYPDAGTVTVDQQSAFQAGFMHAMAGKTKSTLTGEHIADMQRGYSAAMTWRESAEGEAWYEGKPVAKLTNTGLDLRRHWEAMQEQMKAAESDVKKAWRQIERATARADLFSPLLPDGVKPGFRLYVAEIRDNVRPFKEWLQERYTDWSGSEYYRSKYSDNKTNIELMLDGDRYPYGLHNEWDHQEFRANWLREAAADYLARVKDFIGFLDGHSSVAGAAQAFADRFIVAEAAAKVDAPDSKTSGGLSVLTAAGKKIATGRGKENIWGGDSYSLAKLRATTAWTQKLIADEATIALPDKAKPLTPPRLDHVERKGMPDWRGGKNVTPAQFKETFGVADVGFGKWVGSKQDQDHLNYSYDALMDLAKFLGMPPKNIGFGGKMHFTIGALGHGKAAAHFWAAQPSPEGGTVQVINVTNTKGDGTVAHEWTHALDHNLGGEWSRVRQAVLRALKQEQPTPESVEAYARSFLLGGRYWIRDKNGDKVDAAVRGMQHWHQHAAGKSAYKTNADQLGAGYWGNDAELIARASEAWVNDNLGGTNTYLVNPSWVGENNVTGAAGYRGTPYPSGHERKFFSAVYGALARAIKWEDGKPTVAYADFEREMPKDVLEGEKRRKQLMDRENMQAFFDELVRQRLEKDAAAKAEVNAAKKKEQDELDALAAEKLAALQPTIDPPPAGSTQGPLDASDLEALFDEAAAELREERSNEPEVEAPPAMDQEPVAAPAPATAKAPAAPAPAAEKTAAGLIAEAAKLGVTGVDEAFAGLSALFGTGKGRLGMGVQFDEETYAKAKPHFQAALTAFQQAGKTLKDLFKLLIAKFGDEVRPYAIRFAQDQNLTANLGTQAADKPLSPSMQLAEDVARHLRGNGTKISWQSLFNLADARFGGTQAEGKYTPKDAYDAMEAGINKYLMSEQGRAFNPDADSDVARLTLASIERVLDLLPTQTKRTAEQDEYQQFSTVPTLAYLANWVAGVTGSDTMLEPSAGIGGLALFAKNAGAKLLLNELSSRRAALLQELFPGSKVWTENAEQIDNILPPEAEPSVVVMNPPFSNSAATGIKKDTMIGARHVEQALERLAYGGRLVAIVGEGMARDKPAFRDWWKKIEGKYRVRAVVPIDGAGYAKYGTTFDNALLVIDKAAPQANATIVTDKVSKYEELIPLLQEIRNDRNRADLPADDSDGIEQFAAESARDDAIQEGQGDTGGGTAAGGADLLGQGQPAGSGSGVAGTGGRSGGRGGSQRPAGNVQQSGEPAAGEGNNAAGSSARNGETAGRPDTEVKLNAQEAVAHKGEITESIFESYTPQRLQVDGAQPHPGPLVQSAAMASVLPPKPTYTPNLPAKTISKGLLSIAQIESVVYAGQAHSELLPAAGQSEQPARRGFFIGDGTGVGKGREIGGIMLDNLRQGRKKHVWVSEKQGLIRDAQRDFEGVGGDPGIIFNQNKTEAEGDLSGDGILFTTYSTLRSGSLAQNLGANGAGVMTPAQLRKRYPKGTMAQSAQGNNWEIVSWPNKGDVVEVKPAGYTYGRERRLRYDQLVTVDGEQGWGNISKMVKAGKKAEPKAGQSRLDQLVKWLGPDFDGVIAFDEAHNAGNATPQKGERGSSEPSAQALAVVELQKRVPNARVVYVSATGATQVANLSFATRLGLWGPGTPFASVMEFINQMTAGGLATMELVARDMKQMGAYIARALSFDGVTYSRVEHTLTEIQKDQYNRMADGWQVTLQNFEKALEVTGGEKSGKAKSAAKSAFWGAQQRFFNQIITSMQMPTVLEQIERDLAAGDAVVLQLVNTNEAQQERALAKRKEEDESSDLEDLDLTPRDQLIQMVEKSFPVVQYEEFLDDNGKKQSRPAMDSEGKPVLNREAVAMRERLVKDLQQIKVPDGPLELILNQFGPEITAEVTGRKQRIVRKPDAEGNVRAQLETRGSTAANADAEAFLADKKRILIFSDAGGTGYSFHADRTKKNQRKRKHYLIQPGWRADKAVQGFGRTHRTNEASQPHYYLASTNIPAQKRFLSAIARRLDQLGALTKGQRDTANQGLFSEKDNLEGKYATQAVRQFIDDAKRGSIQGVDFNEFLQQTGLEGIVDEDTNAIAEDKYPSTRLFLNRMLSLRLDMQDKVFDAFIARMEEKIEVAIQRNELDTGMQTIRALSTKVKRDEVVYTDPKTGAETRYVLLELTQPTRFHNFPTVESEHNRPVEYVVNDKSGRVWAKIRSGNDTLKNGAVVPRYAMRSTGGTSFKNESELGAGWKKVTAEVAQAMWEAENKEKPATYTTEANMIVGAMLPIWDRLNTGGRLNVARTQTEDGQRLLGRVIEPRDVKDILKRLDVGSAVSKMPPGEIMAEVLKGKTVELANGWTISRSRVSGDLRVELHAKYLTGAAIDELEGMGLMHERIEWKQRFFVPTSAEGAKVMGRLLAAKPAIELIDPNATKDGEDLGDSGAFSQDEVNKAVGFFQQPAPEQRQAVATLQAAADQITAGWENAPEVVATATVSSPSVPEPVRAEAAARLRKGGGMPSGVFFNGRVYLFADRLAADPVKAATVLYHEVLGHFGLRGHFGPEFDAHLEQVANLRREDVRAMIERTGMDPADPSTRIRAAEEVLAYLAQTKPELGLVQRAIALIRSFLRKLPGLHDLQLSDAELIRDFILPARRFVEGGGPGPNGGVDFAQDEANKPFYSALSKGIEGVSATALPVAGWNGAIGALVNKGAVKADEVEWSGVKDWLQLQQGKVSKQDVLDYLQQNGVRVEEVEKGGSATTRRMDAITVQLDSMGWNIAHGDDPRGGYLVQLKSRADGQSLQYDNGWDGFVPVEPGREHMGTLQDDAKPVELPPEVDNLAREYMAYVDNDPHAGADDPLSPRYGAYTLPGGENYRELLLTLPVKEAETFEVPRRDIYKSDHWIEPNIVAHIRMDERTDADGKKVLFIEELQSDWAQEGRRKGFFDPATPWQLFDARTGAVHGNYPTEAEAKAAGAASSMGTWDYADMREKGAPRAPFVDKTDAWLSLALKRIVKYAADNGFDRVAFVNGKQSADRYDLSKHIESVRWWKDGAGKYNFAAMKGGNEVMRQVHLEPEKLASFLGKDVAQKITDGAGVEKMADTQSELMWGKGNTGLLQGLDLKVGGEGMRSFYDKIVPAAVNKLLPKIGGEKVGQTTIILNPNVRAKVMPVDLGGPVDNGRGYFLDTKGRAWDDQMSFDVTPAMREAVAGGLPLFSQRPGFSFNAEQSPLYKHRTATEVRMPAPAVVDAALQTDATARRIMAKGVNVEDGALVGVRLNVNVIKSTGVAVNTIHRGNKGTGYMANRGLWGGEAIAYEAATTLRNAFFNVGQKARERIATGQAPKEPMASVDGNYVKGAKPSFDGVEFRFNPKREHLFRDGLGRVLRRADEATVVGNSVFARGEIEYYGPEDVPARAGEAPTQGRLLEPGDDSGTPMFAQGFNTRQIQVDGVWRPIDASNGQMLHPTFQGQATFWRKYADRFELDGLGRPRVTQEEVQRLLNEGGDVPLFAQDMGLNQPRDYFETGKEWVNELGKTPGKLHWWHKSLGTQYNLAQKSPAFARVFNAVQDFLNDVSLYATEAANRAPTILPQLNSWRDIIPFKALGGSGKKPLSAADNKAIRDPIIQGTLEWTRDKFGNAIRIDAMREAAAHMTPDEKGEQMVRNNLLSPSVLKMWRGLPHEQFAAMIQSRFESTNLKPGIVWTDDELRRHFNATDEQIKLYREFRAATDESVTRLALSGMVRLVGKDADFIRQEVMEAPTLAEGKDLLVQQLEQLAADQPKRADALDKTIVAVEDAARKALELMDRGYAPLMRFGHYTVTVYKPNEDGKEVVDFFGMYESPLAARLAEKDLRANYADEGEPFRIARGTMNEEGYKLFAGVNPETAELFGEMMGLDATGDSQADQAFQQWLKLSRASRSAMKRLIHRKGTAGFSQDMGRVLAAFIYSNARHTSRAIHAGEIDSAVNDIDPSKTGQGELQRQATRLREYVNNPGEEAYALRGLLFAQYLGGSIAAALVNMTQPIQVTMPYLSQFGGISKSTGRMTWALANAWKKTSGDAALDRDMQRAVEEGVVAPQEIHQLMAQGSGKASLRAGDGTVVGNAVASGMNFGNRLMAGWGKPFATAELFNRRVTFAAAYRTAQEEGIANPYEFAKKAVIETQFLYNKGNRPEWARGAVGATLFTFKQYSISYLELLERMWHAGEPGSPERAAGRRAVFFAAGMILLMAGAGGFPFVEDIEDVIDGIMQRMGYNWQSKQKVRELLQGAFGKALGGFMEKGISGFPGMPLDVSGRLGLQNLIPGTGAFQKKEDRSGDVLEIAGPTGDLAKRFFTGVDKASSGYPLEGASEAIAPTALRNIRKAIDMMVTGQYRDAGDNQVIPATTTDAIVKGIGFQPGAVAKATGADRAAQLLVAVAKQRENEIAQMWAKGFADNKPDLKAKARAELTDWNEKNPDTPIKIRLQDVLRRAQKMKLTRAQRIEKSAPPEVRKEARRIMAAENDEE